MDLSLSLSVPDQHAEGVLAVVDAEVPPQEVSVEIASSWGRCVRQYGVDPASSEVPRILTGAELRELRQPLDHLILSAQEEIDRLYARVREAGYTVLLSNHEGVAVEHRGDDAKAAEFKYWGIWLGGVWTERIEGTNGIGTCIADERPITVHRSEHLRTRHVNLSCSGAPIFGPDGRLMAVLDVSSFDPNLSEHALALTGALTKCSARAMSERLFRERFLREWIIAIALPGDAASGMLLAVDKDQRIVGADRQARTRLALDDRALRNGVELWTLFKRDRNLVRRRDGADVPVQLVRAGDGGAFSALVTAPQETVAIGRNQTLAYAHARPRLDSLSTLAKAMPTPSACGALSPAAMRRLLEHIEAHISERMGLSRMAGVVGLSVFHFARSFKRSTGETPRSYLTRRRVERAREMLASTDLRLSEIALAVGFVDQSHLARHFRRIVGVSPSEFRNMRR